MNVLRILILPLLLLPMLLSAQEKDMAKDSTIYITVEQMPQFPGGEAEMNKYIRDNLKIPAVSQEEGICSRLTARFVVNADGSISDIKSIRVCNEALNKSFRDVISKMPNWIPGKQNGREVRVYYTLSMSIHLK